MAILVLRLVLAPSTVLAASLVQRRLGPLRGGRLIGFPLTTAPFLLVLCLGAGTVTAAHAADGIVAGQMAVVAFCTSYGHLAGRLSPAATVTSALAGAVVSAAVVGLVGVPWLIALLVLVAIEAARATWPPERDEPDTGAARPQRPWELPVRVVTSGVLVGVLSAGVRVVGAYLAGVLTTAPVILAVMTPSTHRASGPAAAARLVRGALATMPASVAFVLVLAYTLVLLGPALAFPLALLTLVATDQLTRARRPVTRRSAAARVALPTSTP